MTDIAAFLNARWTEEAERLEFILNCRSGDEDCNGGWDLWGDYGRAIDAAFQPRQMLDDIAAKQKLLGAHRADKNGRCRTCARWTTDWTDDGFKLDHVAYDGVEAPCRTRRMLALPYVGHEGYEPAWGLT
jgi:hypothetical protein